MYLSRTIPLSLLTVSDKGEVIIDKELVLDEREMAITVDTTKPFKLNAGTVGFCKSSFFLTVKDPPLTSITRSRPIYP